MNTRFTPFLMATVLPFLLFSWFIPAGQSQLDIWVLWLVAMVVLGLPMLFLELALAKRSRQSVVGGMQILTREADAKTHWRAFSGLSVMLSLLFASGIISHISERLSIASPIVFVQSLSSYGMAFAFTVLALIISPLKDKLLLVGVAIVVVATLLSLNHIHAPYMTPIGIHEWSVAVTMALFSVGIGTGVYWFLDSQSPATPKTVIKKAVPIWVVQLIAGSLAFVLAHQWTGIGLVLSAFGVIAVASFLLGFAQNQLAGKFGKINGTLITIVLAVVFCAIPNTVIVKVVGFLGLFSVLILAIFAGWVMKISHLRKSLEFGSELSYNVWRVLIRWVVPLAIIVAMMAFVW